MSHTEAGLGGSVGCASEWRPGGRGFDPRRGRQHSFVEIDHEILSTVILSLPLIQEGQLSVSGERMCTILVNRLEDKACPVNVWLGKLTALDMTPLGWLGRKTSTQTNKHILKVTSKVKIVRYWLDFKSQVGTVSRKCSKYDFWTLFDKQWTIVHPAKFSSGLLSSEWAIVLVGYCPSGLLSQWAIVRSPAGWMVWRCPSDWIYGRTMTVVLEADARMRAFWIIYCLFNLPLIPPCPTDRRLHMAEILRTGPFNLSPNLYISDGHPKNYHSRNIKLHDHNKAYFKGKNKKIAY